MGKEKAVVEKAAMSDGGHIITGAQSIFEAPDPEKARFDLNENIFGPSPKVKAAIKNFVDDVGVQWYNAWMRKQCAEVIADYAEVKTKNVFVCNGSAETLVVIAEVFLEPGDELLTFYPTYRVLLNYSKIYGSNIVKVHHEKDFNADNLPRKIIDKISLKTKIIYMVNPTSFGARVPRDEIIAVLEKSQEPPNPLVVVDEAYYDCATYPFSNKTVADLLEKYDNLIVTRTFSKSFALAGLRIGYAISSRHNTESFNKLFSPLGVSSIAYVGAMAALGDPGYYEEVRRKVESNKAYLAEELVRMGIEVFPSYTNFFLAKFSEGILNDNDNRKGVWTRLVKEGIYIRNKSVMYSDSNLCQDMVRITVGERDDCERLIDKLEKILKDF
ncbi:MAG TPA: aminotransferase class I/II-fold pyridoxal phosphate-dependent enzyme [Spirochaetes bacterium]|nr:aminotransferase class I/II-fold pyridoxal phosphate-dependent enzyme [Spirochaetota bacterium]